MKTNDRMIGIIIFFSDVCQPNEDRKVSKKENSGKRKHEITMQISLVRSKCFFNQ